jgi:hypothetical protein
MSGAKVGIGFHLVIALQRTSEMNYLTVIVAKSATETIQSNLVCRL